MRKILRSMGKLLQSVAILVLALLLGCNLYLILMERALGTAHPTVLGYSIAVVASGSMEPALSVDDLIVNRAQDEYAAGDIITFSDWDRLTTHRIVELTPQGYVTKGDANNVADLEPVAPEHVIGRVVLVLPGVGRAIAFLKTPLGAILLIFTGLLIVELPLCLQRRNKKPDAEEL